MGRHLILYSLQSGKLVTKMFQKIQDIIDDKDGLVFVLIDEVGQGTCTTDMWICIWT